MIRKYMIRKYYYWPLGTGQRRHDNITCVDYGISINSSKRYSGCGLHDNGHAHHLCCTLIDIPQSTHMMLSYLLWGQARLEIQIKILQTSSTSPYSVAYLISLTIGEVRKEGQLIITEVIVSWEGDLLVHHIQAIVVVRVIC